jgi:hypothetical protein
MLLLQFLQVDLMQGFLSGLHENCPAFHFQFRWQPLERRLHCLTDGFRLYPKNFKHSILDFLKINLAVFIKMIEEFLHYFVIILLRSLIDEHQSTHDSNEGFSVAAFTYVNL